MLPFVAAGQAKGREKGLGAHPPRCWAHPLLFSRRFTFFPCSLAWEGLLSRSRTQPLLLAWEVGGGGARRMGVGGGGALPSGVGAAPALHRAEPAGDIEAER